MSSLDITQSVEHQTFAAALGLNCQQQAAHDPAAAELRNVAAAISSGYFVVHDVETPSVLGGLEVGLAPKVSTTGQPSEPRGEALNQGVAIGGYVALTLALSSCCCFFLYLKGLLPFKRHKTMPHDEADTMRQDDAISTKPCTVSGPTLLRADLGKYTQERIVQDVNKKRIKAKDETTSSVHSPRPPSTATTTSAGSSSSAAASTASHPREAWGESSQLRIVAASSQPPSMPHAPSPPDMQPPVCRAQYVDLPPQVLHNLRVAARTKDNASPRPLVPAVPHRPVREVRAGTPALPPVRVQAGARASGLHAVGAVQLPGGLPPF